MTVNLRSQILLILFIGALNCPVIHPLHSDITGRLGAASQMSPGWMFIEVVKPNIGGDGASASQGGACPRATRGRPRLFLLLAPQGSAKCPFLPIFAS
jgi:hypothetical protein